MSDFEKARADKINTYFGNDVAQGDFDVSQGLVAKRFSIWAREWTLKNDPVVRELVVALEYQRINGDDWRPQLMQALTKYRAAVGE